MIMGHATITMRKAGDAAEARSLVLRRELSSWQRFWGNTFLRKTLIILVLAVAWQVYGHVVDNDLLFPTLSDTFVSFVDSIRSGVLPDRVWTSIRLLLMGYALGIAI